MENHQTGRGPVAELELDTNGYPTGNDGTVWATFDVRQADIIRNALLTQRISCELKEVKTKTKPLYVLRIADVMELAEAMDFIWRESSGLRLKPDWSYADGEINKSFEQWLGGH